MAVLALTDAKVVINSVNLSTWVVSPSLQILANLLESTAMGATYQARIGGLKDATFTVEFNQDFAASAPDVTLFALIGTSTAVTFKATSSANSSTNPEYQFNALLESYEPLGNSVGDKATAKATFRVNGAVTRAVV